MLILLKNSQYPIFNKIQGIEMHCPVGDRSIQAILSGRFFSRFSWTKNNGVFQQYLLLVDISIEQDLTSALTSTTRREYIHVGSSSASMLPTVVEASTEIMS